MAYPSVSYTFTNGTVADGANVSTNFSNLVSGLSDGTKDLNMNAATFAGNLTANGNIVLGNATSDTVILTGIVSLATAGSYISNLLGSALLPSYSFTGDVNTGIWSSGADNLSVSTAGVQRINVNADGDIQMGAIVAPVSSTAGRKYLTIEGLTTTPSVIQLGNATGGAAVALGQIEWYNRDNSGSSSFRTAFMQAGVEGTTANNRGSYIVFATKADGVSGAGTTAFKINNTGSVEASLGTALLPGYSFTNDLNTGMWSSGADTINFSLAGEEKLRIESTGPTIFGTGDTTRFTIYGTTTPGFQGFGFGGSYASPTASALGQSLVLISGRGYGTGFTGTKGSMAINAEALWTATSNPTYITFTTTPAASVTPVERMRIDSSGNIAIATTVATNVTAGRTYLSIKGTSAAQPGVLQLINFTGDGTGQNLGNIEWVNPDNTSSSSLRSASIAAITYGSTANNRGSYIIFATKADGVSGGGTERMQIDSSGQVGIGLTPTARNNCNLQLLNGIGFPATQVASSDVNTLDDYEEGTWTPSIGGTATYTIQSARYTKIGQYVHIHGRLRINVIGTGSTTTISGLPFANNASVPSTAHIGYFSSIAGNVVYLAGIIDAAQTTIFIYSMGAAGTALGGNAIFQNSTDIMFSGTYTV